MALAERSESFTVGDRLLTDVGGTLPRRVLSTPGMIGMMERTAALLAAEYLAGERVVGVGTHERRTLAPQAEGTATPTGLGT